MTDGQSITRKANGFSKKRHVALRIMAVYALAAVVWLMIYEAFFANAMGMAAGNTGFLMMRDLVFIVTSAGLLFLAVKRLSPPRECGDASGQDISRTHFKTDCASLRAMLDATPSQQIVVDTEGNIVAVNRAWMYFAEKNTDSPLQRQQLGIGGNFFDTCSHVAGPETGQARIAEAGVRRVLAGEETRFSMECPCATPEGTLWFMMTVTPLPHARGAVITYTDITSTRASQEAQAQLAHQFKALAQRHLDIQEEERHRLSMELHDHVGQMLAGLQISLDNGRHDNSDPQALLKAVDRASDIVHGMAETIHDMARQLRPPLLDDLGLLSAVNWHLEKLPRPRDVRIRFEQDIGAARFPATVELAAFRIIQESVSNALRHAGANEIAVRLSCSDDRLQLSVSDDGHGFDVGASLRNLQPHLSLGLIGMRERVIGVGGELQINSNPAAGTEILARMPKDATP